MYANMSLCFRPIEKELELTGIIDIYIHMYTYLHVHRKVCMNTYICM
jgi:hypothetical protein